MLSTPKYSKRYMSVGLNTHLGRGRMIKISEKMRPKWATLSYDTRIRPQDSSEEVASRNSQNMMARIQPAIMTILAIMPMWMRQIPHGLGLRWRATGSQ